MCIYSVDTPSVGVVELAKYVCTHPYLIFTEEDPELLPEDVDLGFRSAPNFACELGSLAGSFAWRKTLMTSL